MSVILEWLLANEKRAVVSLIVGTFSAAVAGGWTVYQASASRADTVRSAEISRLIEAQKPFLEKQLGLYFEAAKITGKLVTLTPDDTEWAASRQRFWELYWSELSFVEDNEVESSMVNFGNQLTTYENSAKMPADKATLQSALHSATFQLAHALRSSLEREWSRTVHTAAPATPETPSAKRPGF